MRRFIAFSGGVESTAMCVLFVGSADAIFADTGFEHKLLYDRIDRVSDSISKIHGRPFVIHKVRRDGPDLKQYILKSKFYPSFHSRFCTRMFKIEPMDRFLSQFESEGVELMIGL